MERLKHAIAIARETARQDLEQAGNATGNASPKSGVASASNVEEPKRNTWSLVIAMLLGLVAVIAFWTMRPDSGAASRPATEQPSPPSEPAAAPQVAIATPAQPVEMPPPTGVDTATPAGGAAPAVATEAISPEKPPELPLDEQVEAAVETWRQAWSARDMVAYLDAYSETFTPPNGESFEDWVASRYRNVGGRKSIDVRINNLQVEPVGDDRARVSFTQDYASGSYRETEQPKTLDMVRDASGRWRINGEWQGKPPPLPSTSAS